MTGTVTRARQRHEAPGTHSLGCFEQPNQSALFLLHLFRSRIESPGFALPNCLRSPCHLPRLTSANQRNVLAAHPSVWATSQPWWAHFCLAAKSCLLIQAYFPSTVFSLFVLSVPQSVNLNHAASAKGVLRMSATILRNRGTLLRHLGRYLQHHCP